MRQNSNNTQATIDALDHLAALEAHAKNASKRTSAAEARARLDLLVGRCPPRRQFIKDNALNVQYLDV